MEMIPSSRWDLLDLVFEGRNKAYGAYDLRRYYNRRLLWALSLTGIFCLLFCGVCLLGRRWDPPGKSWVTVDSDLTLIKPVILEPLVQIPKTQFKKIESAESINFKIVRNVPADPQNEDPPKADPGKTNIGTNTPTGDSDDPQTPAPQASDKGETVIPKKSEGTQSPFIPVEIESSYPGGMDAWKRFLIQHFHTPEQAISKGIQGTVIVEFVVDLEGNLGNVQAISGPEELKAEAVKVIRESGRWIPAIQNGRAVKSVKRQPIVVRFESE
jgi:periplasmic protein TonB